jgi:hypothetical protein
VDDDELKQILEEDGRLNDNEIKRIVVTNNGFDDLERQGYSGKGFWVGYKHGRRGTSEMKMKSAVEEAAEALAEHFYGSDAEIEDHWKATDMFRVYQCR